MERGKYQQGIRDDTLRNSSILTYLLYHRTICIHKIFNLCSLVMFISFPKNDTLQSGSYDGSRAIKTWLIGTVYSCSLYRYSFSCSPNNSVHFCVDFIFIWPVVMSAWIIHSTKMISAIFISCWSSIISCRYNSSSFYNYWACLTRNTLWSRCKFIGYIQKIFIV